MKKYSLFFLLFIPPFFLQAQADSLRDYIWLTGFASNPTYLEYGGTDFNFHETPMELHYTYRELNFDLTNASICDENGELLFYSNGIRICNRFNDTIPNGNGLNPGYYAEEFENNGYLVPNGAFVLPHPVDPDLYYLIHESYDYYESVHSLPSFFFITRWLT